MEPQPPTLQSWFCPRCGTSNAMSASTCTYCQTPYPYPAPSSPPAQQMQPAQPLPPQSQPQQPPSQPFTQSLQGVVIQNILQPQYPQPSGYACPNCHNIIIPIQQAKISTAGWVIFFVLLLTCYGIVLCWIGFLLKQYSTHCPRCGIKLAG